MSYSMAIREEAERLESALRRRLGGQVRDLSVKVLGQGITLHGRASTYFAKQLAQQAALELTELPMLANDIEVR